MKQYVLKLIANSMILLLPLSMVAQSGWSEFTDHDGNFGVSLPDNPKRTEKDRWVIFYLNREGIGYFVQYEDEPSPPPPEEALNLLRDVFLKQTGGRLLSERSLKLNGRYPGKELKVQASDTIGQIRIYIVNRRIYELGSNRPGSQGSNNFAKFLNSFRLLSD